MIGWLSLGQNTMTAVGNGVLLDAPTNVSRQLQNRISAACMTCWCHHLPSVWVEVRQMAVAPASAEAFA